MERSPHILVFPHPAQGHMIPLLDLTHSLACHGLSLTVLTTPEHQSLLDPLLHKATTEGLSIQSLVIPLPLHEGHSFKELSQPIEDWFQQQKKSTDNGLGPPVCIISDFFLGWTHNTAAKLGIPRVVFHPSGAFTVSLNYSLWKYMPHEELSSDSDTVHIPEFPHPVSFPNYQISRRARRYKGSDPLSEFVKYGMNLNVESWGTIINTFYNLESVYIDHLRRFVSGRHVWSVGPLLPPAVFEMKQRTNLIERGKPSSINESVCLQWLDSRREKSVIYISFGSRVCLTNQQIEEIAAGLEASEEFFIWVIRDSPNPQSSMPADECGVVPLGFEERMEGRGLIIRGWAPQLLILSHPSVGGFLTHCGWNSTLESIRMGVPLITWPMSADQYYNARLLVEYLKVGVSFCEGETTVPNRDDLKIAVKRLLAREGEEVKRLEELSRAATMAVQEGGSSHSNMEAFVSELKKLIPQPKYQDDIKA